eukprot:3593031-Prymnesium_polylepis.2
MLPIATAVRKSDESAPTDYPMLELIFPSPEAAKSFMTDYPSKDGGGRLVSTASPAQRQAHVHAGALYIRCPHNERGIQPGPAPRSGFASRGTR